MAKNLQKSEHHSDGEVMPWYLPVEKQLCSERDKTDKPKKIPCRLKRLALVCCSLLRQKFLAAVAQHKLTQHCCCFQLAFSDLVGPPPPYIFDGLQVSDSSKHSGHQILLMGAYQGGASSSARLQILQMGSLLFALLFSRRGNHWFFVPLLSHYLLFEVGLVGQGFFSRESLLGCLSLSLVLLASEHC